MTGFNEGDRVRVTYEAEYINDAEVLGSSGVVVYPLGSTVELIERADHPRNDLVGTIREGLRATLPLVKIQHDTWVQVSLRGKTRQDVRTYSDELVGARARRILGAVPGTPAAGAAQERPLWTGDGTEEPPEHVDKVRDKDGDELSRVDPDEFGRVWRRTKYYSGGALPTNNIPWPYIHGPYTEVR